MTDLVFWKVGYFYVTWVLHSVFSFLPVLHDYVSGDSPHHLSGSKEEDYRLPFLSHQQLPAGILLMVPEVAQAVGASPSQGHQNKDYGPRANPAKVCPFVLVELAMVLF